MRQTATIFCAVMMTVMMLSLAGLTSDAEAQQFVYEPKNPAFGGNPMNYSWMMNSANAQNQHEATRDPRLTRDPIQDFQASLQRQVLSQLTRDIARRQLGLTDEEFQESRFEFGEFTIEIIPGVDGVQLLIFNILTGDETSITIPNF